MKKSPIVKLFSWVSLAIFFAGCQSTGNQGGSKPLNSVEEAQYEQAIVRCYKTGGTRVVKILGKLRCY